MGREIWGSEPQFAGMPLITELLWPLFMVIIDCTIVLKCVHSLHTV